jgi:hypothetical protein
MGDAVGGALADAQAAVVNVPHDVFRQPLSVAAEGTPTRGRSHFACFAGRARENAGVRTDRSGERGPAWRAFLAGAEIGRPGRDRLAVPCWADRPVSTITKVRRQL